MPDNVDRRLWLLTHPDGEVPWEVEQKDPDTPKVSDLIQEPVRQDAPEGVEVSVEVRSDSPGMAYIVSELLRIVRPPGMFLMGQANSRTSHAVYLRVDLGQIRQDERLAPILQAIEQDVPDAPNGETPITTTDVGPNWNEDEIDPSEYDLGYDDDDFPRY